ncbi:MAG: TetR/AcrR family transcriptional regulator [Planctomycetota bacterium]
MEPDKRAAVLAAAERLFRECRIHELTMDEVARAADVSKGTIYRYFKNKDDLLFQLATEGSDRICEVVARTPAMDAFHDRLVYLCKRIGEFFQKHCAIMRIIQEHEGRFGSLSQDRKACWSVHRRKLVGAVAAVLSQGAAEGWIRPDLPMNVLANLLLGMLRSRWRDYTHAPEERPPIAAIVDVFLLGVGGGAQEPDGWKGGAGAKARRRVRQPEPSEQARTE